MSGNGDRSRKPLRDRVLDRIPLFGTVRRTKGWIRRHKGWVYLILAVVVLFVVKPVLTILAGIFEIFRPMIAALIDNPVGRFLFYNALAVLLLWWVWTRVRSGVRRVFGMFAMRSFLDGLNAMILGRWEAAIPSFQKVLRTARTFRLEDAVPEHRDIAVDAQLKIATCHLRLGRPNDAKAWLLRVKEKDILTEHVRRNHAELRALAYDLNDELEQETVLKELERTEARDARNRRVLRALRERLEAAEDLDGARRMARRLVEVSEGPEKESAEEELALLEFRLAHKALDEGDARRLRKALKASSGDTRSALMLGDVALQQGDVKGALKAWSRAVSLPVFDRLAQLLESGRLSGDQEKDLWSHFPYVGTLLTLAEYNHRRGEFRKARTALEKVLETAGQNLTVLRLYAACLEGEGHTAEAAELYRRALSMSFG